MANTAKTGLAARMREWMKQQTKPFSRGIICQELNVAAGKEHEHLSTAITDFVNRGEVIALLGNPLIYKYNHAWRPASKGSIKPKILKAIYVSIVSFTVADIQKLSGAPDKSLVTKTVKKLKDAGHLTILGSKLCAHGAGAETIYKVTNREKFKIEML
ncbi:MAG TPA: hypothetical protein PKM59_11680 [Thermodesulfobacteriota bacterium]|nr:hypothetical protein [Thermodesulfobacteriota bacterium]HNU70394.1 hypothetical protein [Thermodesulfobacteriota bacterium]